MPKETTKSNVMSKDILRKAVERLVTPELIATAVLIKDENLVPAFYKARLEKIRASKAELTKRYDEAIAFYEREIKKLEKTAKAVPKKAKVPATKTGIKTKTTAKKKTSG